jgi:hypothetical protein
VDGEGRGEEWKRGGGEEGRRGGGEEGRRGGDRSGSHDRRERVGGWARPVD